MKHCNTRRAFTIVELVIVIAVIALLAVVLIPTFGSMITKAQDSRALQEAKNAYTQYFIDHAAEALARHACTYFTCHCTGKKQFDYLKNKLGERLHYFAGGMSVEL